jgi:hypothetical protein
MGRLEHSGKPVYRARNCYNANIASPISGITGADFSLHIISRSLGQRNSHLSSQYADGLRGYVTSISTRSLNRY